MPKLPTPALSYHRAARKSFEETIVFTHHWGGNNTTTKRHQEFLNELGFDCVSFDLNCKSTPTPFTSFASGWYEELQSVLNSVPGNKIMYTFSSPSAVTLAAIVIEKRKDVRAWITDGGPFFDVYECFKKFYTFIEPVPAWCRSLVAAAGYVRVGAVGSKSKVKKLFEKFPREIPILSIRAGQDKLVPVSAIDAFFDAGKNLNFQRFEIPEAQHLEGLKTSPDLYKAAVKEFLLKHARAINL